MDCLIFRNYQTFIARRSIARMKFIRSRGSQGNRIPYYSDSTACFRLEMLLPFDIEVNPGSQGKSTRSVHELKCLYLNSRSIVKKTKQLEALAESKEYYLTTITETWLSNSVRNNEFLQKVIVFTVVMENYPTEGEALCPLCVVHYVQLEDQT